MHFYLGLDNGGTNTKAALFDRNGNMVSVSSVATAAITPSAGVVERDMEDMWSANCTVIRRVIEQSGIASGDIAGVAVCGHGKGLYLWGKDGRPARRGILSSDNRAMSYTAAWAENGIESAAFEKTYQHLMACQPDCLLAWLRDNEPETLSNTAWIFECKDYVRFRLTGEARAEISDISGTGLLDLGKRSYSRELLELYGISSIYDALPPLCGSFEIAGSVSKEAAGMTGLLEGTPVIGGMFDIDACALAVNVTDEENICMIAGTWSINEYLRREPVLDGSVRMNSLFCIDGYYLVEESSPTSAGNNEWFIRRLLPELTESLSVSGRNVYEEMNSWASAFSPGDPVPVFLPFLSAGNEDPLASAAFLGLNSSHTRRHMLRSVYEGIAFSHRYHLERLLRTRSDTDGCIRLAGGAARSAVWTQMFADVMKMPVQTVSAGETGALGCAIALAAALGDYASVSDAAAAMSRLSPAVLPSPDATEAYARKYALYRKAIRCLSPFWKDLSASAGGV